MNKFLITLLLTINIIGLIGLLGCSSSNSSTRTNSLEIDGSIVGKDGANRDATVVVDSESKTLNINLKSATEDITLNSAIILIAEASSGKKLATGDIAYSIDLKITSSNLTGFAVNGISYGTIFKKVDAQGVATFTCAFNFTNQTARATNSTDSNWAMSGTKTTIIP